MKNKIILISALVFVLTSCATSKVSLKKDIYKKLASIEHIVYVPQNNLDVSAINFNPGNTGILGVLIASALTSVVQSSAEEEAAPLIAELQDFDFREHMINEINEAVNKNNAIPYTLVNSLETTDSESSRRITLKESKSNAVLFTNISYKLISSKLVINAEAKMFPRVKWLYAYSGDPDLENSLDDGNIIYKQKFTYEMQGVNKGNIKKGLSEGAKSISRQLLSDLSHPV